MGVVIDTSVVIEIERRGGGPEALRSVAEEGPVLLSVITVGELWYGIERVSDARRRARQTNYLDSLLAFIDVLSIERPDARAYAMIRRTLEGRGTPIGPNDLWIAAQAIARGHAVATANLRKFARVPGLRVIG